MSQPVTELSPEHYAQQANLQLAELREVLSDRTRFEPTRHSQWCHLKSGCLIEAGYVYGEPWAKVLTPDGRRELEHFRFIGRSREQLDALLASLA